MSVNGISYLNGYKPMYGRKSQENNQTPVSFGYGNDDYQSSVATSYIQKQQAQKQQIELEKQKKDKWKQFGLDVLKGVTIGAALIGGTALVASCTKAGREMAQSLAHNYGLSDTASCTDGFQKSVQQGEVSYKSCKKILNDNLQISESQKDEVFKNICTANKKIRTERYGGHDVNPSKNRGIILYGRGGIGKSYAMETIAKACGASYISKKGNDFLSKWQGESEAKLQSLFNEVKAQAEKTPDNPVIVFLDEGQAILGDGRTENGNNTNANLRAMLLGAMETEGPDALPPNVKFIVTTNYVDDIDEPYRRDGRLGIPMELQAPTAEGQANIMRKQFKEQFKDEYKNFKDEIENYITERTSFMKSIEGNGNDEIKSLRDLEQTNRGNLEKALKELSRQSAIQEKLVAQGRITKKDMENELKSYKETVEKYKISLEAAHSCLIRVQEEKSNGRYFNFSPAEIKGFVANTMELLTEDFTDKGGFCFENLKNLECEKVEQLREAAKIDAENHAREMAKRGY